jgi:glycosyltransferase involved in cell wall biosynthesis
MQAPRRQGGQTLESARDKQMKNPRVTVLMPVHNGGSYLLEAVNSILAQTFPDFEFLIVDDASTDQTVAYLQGIRDPRIRLLKSEQRLQIARALNLGLDHAKGKWIARMDADDISLPDRLSRQLDFLVKYPEVGLCGGRITYFGFYTGRFHDLPLSYEDVRSSALFDNPFTHPTVMMRRDLFERYHLRYDPDYCPADDYELWVRAMNHFPAMNMDRVVLRYRTHKQSLTSMEWTDMDAHSYRIAARQLSALGLDVDQETVRFHRNIGRIGNTEIREIKDLQRAEQWLQRILAANNQTKYYPPEVLRRVVGDIWYRVCYHAKTRGFATLRHYQRSPLRLLKPPVAKEYGAILKNALWTSLVDRFGHGGGSQR